MIEKIPVWIMILTLTLFIMFVLVVAFPCGVMYETTPEVIQCIKDFF